MKITYLIVLRTLLNLDMAVLPSDVIVQNFAQQNDAQNLMSKAQTGDSCFQTLQNKLISFQILHFNEK